jgi:hypothetical protein
MEGSMCLVKNAPDQADFAKISRAMAERAARGVGAGRAIRIGARDRRYMPTMFNRFHEA